MDPILKETTNVPLQSKEERSSFEITDPISAARSKFNIRFTPRIDLNPVDTSDAHLEQRKKKARVTSPATCTRLYHEQQKWTDLQKSQAAATSAIELFNAPAERLAAAGLTPEDKICSSSFNFHQTSKSSKFLADEKGPKIQKRQKNGTKRMGPAQPNRTSETIRPHLQSPNANRQTCRNFKWTSNGLQMEGKDRVQKLSSFWCKVGMRRYKRAMLPRWTLQDSLDLIRDVEAQKEDDEHCVDFESIFKTDFQGRCQDRADESIVSW
jgi:hypothetical protein